MSGTALNEGCRAVEICVEREQYDEPKGNSIAWVATPVAMAAKDQASPRMRTWHLLAITDRRSGATSSRPTHSDQTEFPILLGPVSR
jgi:hypothetical protein